MLWYGDDLLVDLSCFGHGNKKTGECWGKKGKETDASSWRDEVYIQQDTFNDFEGPGRSEDSESLSLRQSERAYAVRPDVTAVANPETPV